MVFEIVIPYLGDVVLIGIHSVLYTRSQSSHEIRLVMVNETWHGPFRQSHETCRRAGHVTFMHRHERKDDEFVVLVVMGTVSMDDRFIAVPGYPGYPGPSPPL